MSHSKIGQPLSANLAKPEATVTFQRFFHGLYLLTWIPRHAQTMHRLRELTDSSFLGLLSLLDADWQELEGFDHISNPCQRCGQPQVDRACVMRHPARQVEKQKTQTLGPCGQKLCR